MNNVAIFGYGTVGSGLYDYLKEDRDTNVVYVFGRENKREILKDLLVTDAQKILNDPAIDTVFECLGHDTLSYEIIKGALKKGKAVITSNKETISKHLDEYLRLAKENSTSIQFEAAVGGEIPLINPLILQSSFEPIYEIQGILNGTTNYILTKMNKDGLSFQEALKLAQENGFAEQDPSADILGTDLKRKAIILASILTRSIIKEDKIHVFPMKGISKKILEENKQKGTIIKYLADIRNTETGLSVLISLAALRESPLSQIEYEKNAVLFRTHKAGDILISSNGAGKYPTANSMMQDYVRRKSNAVIPFALGGEARMEENIKGKFICYRREEKTILEDPARETLNQYDVVIQDRTGESNERI